ncbi:MAG: hypothetical protein ACI8UD_002044 [Planctomycetota bacterium]|jgi:hypothetical protein
MRTLFATLLLAAAIPCQASVSTFGTACSLQNQTPSIGHTGTPRIGQTISITYQGPNYSSSSAQQIAQPFLALGTQALGFSIPMAGLIYQPSDCTAYVAPMVLVPMLQDPNLPQYESSFALAIPNDTALVGYQFFAQWLLVHTQCGFTGCGLSGLITSDAAVVTIGQ